MEERLENAMENIREISVVVSGGGGAGKTAMIKRVAQKAEKELVEIDSMEEYMEYRIRKTIVYLLRVTEGMRVRKCKYKGIIFETDNPYFYRKIKDAIHIKITQAPIRTVRKHCPDAVNRTSMHRILQTAKMPKNIHRILLETDTTNISFFHVIGKILYHKTKDVPAEVQRIIEDTPHKTLSYIHENIPEFSENISDLSKVLDKVSLAVDRIGLLYAVIYEIWHLNRHTPKSFYNIRTSPYRIE